jgi:N-methylhydantoinase B
MPVEVTETISPIVFWRKEFRPDSGGAGKWRGGHGQIVELGNREGCGFTMANTYERTVNPARGRSGGSAGATGSLYRSDGEKLPPIGISAIDGDKRAILEFPGGGGFGNPSDRDPELRMTYPLEYLHRNPLTIIKQKRRSKWETNNTPKSCLTQISRERG